MDIDSKTANRLIASYEELVELVRHTKQENRISIENVHFCFDLDLCRLLKDVGVCVRVDVSQSYSSPIFTLQIFNANCKKVIIPSRFFEDTLVDLQIKSCRIDSLKIYSWDFRSFVFKETEFNEFAIIDSNIQEGVNFDFSKLSSSTPFIINFEDTIFEGNVSIYNLRMINKDSLFTINSSRSEIKGDFILSNSWLLLGVVELSCNFVKNCIIRDINSTLEDEENLSALNLGSIIIIGGCVKGCLIIECCHIHCLDIFNTIVEDAHECLFTYNMLKNDAPTILRNGAIRNNNFTLIEKHTGEVLDAYFKDKAVTAYKRWLKTLKGEKINKLKKNQNKLTYSIWEAMALFIPSLFSSEGLLLWLNKYSNDFNRSWIRGIGFTLITTLFFYYVLNYVGMENSIFVFDIHFNGYGKVIKGYLSLLDVFNITGINNEVSFELTTLGYIILFVAKVFITYGAWQTIYAFFRFRK